jgi:hypothetical protein
VKITLLVITILFFLTGCDQQIPAEKIEQMTLNCHNSLDSYDWYTILIFHHNTVDLDNNWGGRGNSVVKLKNLNISETNIHIDYEFDETKQKGNINKTITESWDINRFTGKYQNHTEWFRTDGTKDVSDWSGDCKKEEVIKKF